MRTYTCDRCLKTEENPKDWLTVDTSPLHSSRMTIALGDESEYHYCPVCAPHIEKVLNVKRTLFAKVD